MQKDNKIDENNHNYNDNENNDNIDHDINNDTFSVIHEEIHPNIHFIIIGNKNDDDDNLLFFHIIVLKEVTFDLNAISINKEKEIIGMWNLAPYCEDIPSGYFILESAPLL